MGNKTNYLLVKALPLVDEIKEFIANNNVVYVVEQDRNAQFLKILLMEYRDRDDKLRSVLNYNGMTIDAMTIANGILEQERVAV